MSFISKSGADFLEESNATRYLQSDGKCNKARATNWIERNGIPEELSESSCYSVKSPFSIEEKFFLNLPDAIERAESINNSILYQYKGKDKSVVVYDEEGQSDADMIANFMMYDSDDDCNWLIDTDDDHYTICHSDLDTEEQWSSSWNWLMPVVRAITTNEKYIGNEYREGIADVICFGHIDDVYDSVINFIKHLNDE
jgi:hypothetical protein